MKVVIDARLLLSHETGIGRYITKLAQTLPTMSADQEFEFWVQSDLRTDHPIFSFAHTNLIVKKIPIGHMTVAAQWKIVDLLRQHKPDIYHYPHFDLPFGVPGKVVVTLHDIKYISRPEFFTHAGWLKRTIMKIMMGFSVRRANRVIAISDFTTDEIINIFRVNPSKIRTIHQGIEASKFQSFSPQSITAYLQRKNLTSPYILVVSERRPHKNIIGSIQAFNNFLRLANEEYQLVIAGKAYSDYDEPEKTIENLGLGGSVKLLDHVPDQDLPLLYGGAQATLFISLYEGFGLPVLESMAAGVPVIAANSTALPEVVGDAGLLVDPFNPNEVAAALLEVISSGKLREQYIQRGYERVMLFDLENTARKTLAVYQEVINR